MSALFRAKRTADFDGLYRHHAPSVYRYAYAVLGNHADAEDVTQQTFFNAYRAIAQGTKPRKAENWLITIAHNEVRRHFRSSQGKPFEVEFNELVAHPAPERTDPSLAEVLRALQQLPPPQRAALVMREFEGRSYAEIAQIMNVTQSTLEGLIFRARRALAEHLEGALTCSEAEQALSRRLDGRLPRREGRRLKAHLRACPLCIRFADVQKRQRSLLKGLSIMPIPASLFLFRGEPAVAATGLGAGTAAGGTAALGIGGAAAGAGGTGIAAGVVAKVAAVAAAAAVTGGVGYGAATGFDAVTKPERKVTHAAAVEQTLRGKRSGVAAALDLAPRSGRDRQAKAHGHRKARKAKAAPANSRLRGEKAEKAEKVEKPEKGVARARGKAALVVKASPSKPAATKPQEPKARTRPAAAKKTGRIERARPKPVRPKPVQRAQADEKPKPSHDADPAPPPDVPGRGPKK